MANKISKLASSVRKKSGDTFERADQSGVGTSSDGSLWSAIKGSFNIVSGKAVGADSSYPIIATSLPFSDANIELSDIGQGVSAALWVTGSGDWWAVGVEQEAQNCNCVTNYSCLNGTCGGNCIGYTTTCNGYTTNADSGCAFNCSAKNAATCGGYAIMGYNTSTCKGYNTANCKSFYKSYCSGGYNTSTCTGYNGSNPYYAPQGWANCTGFTAGNCIYYNYFCNSYGFTYCSSSTTSCDGTNATYCCTALSPTGQTCQTCYPRYVRLVQSVGSTITEIAKWAISNVASSMRVKTSGSQITVQSFSDANLVTQIDSDIVYTPTGAAITPMYGITVQPSVNQGYSVGSININKN